LKETKSFLSKCRRGKYDYSLTPNAEPTAFARCFAIFILHFLELNEYSAGDRKELALIMVQDLLAYKAARQSSRSFLFDKPFMQLLTFTLSSLAIIDQQHQNSVDQLICELASMDVELFLKETRALEGVAQSGNLAMFLAIVLIHSKSLLGPSSEKKIEQWVNLHKESMNQFGFWGKDNEMTYLQFQNGYHQYEILHFLGLDEKTRAKAARSVMLLADKDGRFAPYPGGGGCYDYDAIAILSSAPNVDEFTPLFIKTASSILADRNSDGGYCETKWVRPRSASTITKNIKHLLINSPGKIERIKYVLNLARPKHNRIKTHWSAYSRNWHESDLWDTWFRLLTLERIKISITKDTSGIKKFIDYPGIGYF
jgi:hypothetical protein